MSVLIQLLPPDLFLLYLCPTTNGGGWNWTLDICETGTNIDKIIIYVSDCWILTINPQENGTNMHTCIAKNSTIQYIRVAYRMAQNSTAQYDTVQYGIVQYSKVWYSTVQYCTVRYSTVQYSTVQYSTVWSPPWNPGTSFFLLHSLPLTSSHLLLIPPSYFTLLPNLLLTPPNSSYLLPKDVRWLMSSYMKRFQCYSAQKRFLGGWVVVDIAIIASSSRSRSLRDLR